MRRYLWIPHKSPRHGYKYTIPTRLRWSPELAWVDGVTGTVNAFALRGWGGAWGWAARVVAGEGRRDARRKSAVEGDERLVGHPSGRKPACFLLTPTH